VLLKKYFLDVRPGSDFQVNELSESDLNQLLIQVSLTVNFGT